MRISRRTKKSILGALRAVLWVFALVGMILSMTLETSCESVVAAETRQTEAPAAAEPVLYDVPLADDLQEHIWQECQGKGVPAELVIGLIQKESNFDADAIGDFGRSIGLMQIQPQWHQERMEYLGAWNLRDPFDNVTVGVDILAELLEQYATTEEALMVYNAGATGAKNAWFDYGIFSNDYSRTVLAYAEALTVKEVSDMSCTPDNYDVWEAHDSELERELAERPVCEHCEENIQQDSAVQIDGEWYCDDCLDNHLRKDID